MTRTALVTGGSRGLGRAAALALAEDGADVVVTYVRDRTSADEVVALITAAGGRAAALALDTSAVAFEEFADALRSVLDGWGAAGLDVLVNNAGVAGHTPFGSITADDMDALHAIHVRGPVLLTQALAPLLVDRGHVLNVSTGLTRFTGGSAYSVYAAMKGAVEVWTRYLAKELGRGDRGELDRAGCDGDRLRRRRHPRRRALPDDDRGRERDGSRGRADGRRARRRGDHVAVDVLGHRPAHRGLGRPVPLTPPPATQRLLRPPTR